MLPEGNCLLNWYDPPLSTGPLEGLNDKIGAMQRRAYAYRNYEHLKERLLPLHHTKDTRQGESLGNAHPPK